MRADTQDLNQWIELDQKAYKKNIEFFRGLCGEDRELSAVVKANAYGHGLDQVVRIAVEAGVDSFSVHSIDEAVSLREAGIEKDILVMGYTPRSRLGTAVDLDLRLVVYDLPTVEALSRISNQRGKRIRVHVKAETGTHRQGVEGAELEALFSALGMAPGCVVEGIYTHFANIEDTTRHDYARMQMDAFAEVVELARVKGLSVPKIHSACSAAALLFPETYGTMIRLGISQYGLWPSRQTYLSYRLLNPESPNNVLSPVLTWKCRVSQIKSVPAGRFVGYGGTFLTTRDSLLAVLPVGYSDGYDRALSNLGYVLIKGRRAQIRGRICMNLTLVDVTDIPGVAPEDEVVLIGTQDGSTLLADDLADMTGTINYEIVSRISPSFPRFVV